MNRKLSPLEQAVLVIDRCINQNFVIIAKISGKTPDTILRKALDIVQKRHPPMNYRIKLQQGPPEFETENVPSIPLRVIERKNKTHWLKEAELEMLNPLPWTKGPLVRVLKLQSPSEYELLITFCHLTADATSGVKFVQNLLRVIDKLSRNEAMGDDEIGLPFFPSSLDLLRDDIKEKAVSSTIVDDEELDKYPVAEIIGAKIVPPERRITRIINITFFQAEIDMLIKRCRTEKTSVHGAICAALLLSLAANIRLNSNVPKNGPLKLGCCTPVNIRHLFNQPVGEDIGNYISDALHYHLIEENSSFWDIARGVRSSLQKILEARDDIKAIINFGDEINADTNVIDYVRNFCQSFPSVVVTNLGQLDISEKFGDLDLEKVHFCLGISPVSKDGLGVAVTSFGGILTLNFLYTEPLISKRNATILAKDFTQRLKNALK